MAYILASTTIRRPNAMEVTNTTQYAQQRTLKGGFTRDYFGEAKQVWVLEYENAPKADYDTIKAILDSHISTGNTKTWQVTETNYSVGSTDVHINLDERGFTVKGTTYLSNFTLILTEA